MTHARQKITLGAANAIQFKIAIGQIARSCGDLHFQLATCLSGMRQFTLLRTMPGPEQQDGCDGVAEKRQPAAPRRRVNVYLQGQWLGTPHAIVVSRSDFENVVAGVEVCIAQTMTMPQFDRLLVEAAQLVSVARFAGRCVIERRKVK